MAFYKQPESRIHTFYSSWLSSRIIIKRSKEKKKRVPEGSPAWNGLLQRGCFIHSSELSPYLKTALLQAPSSLPGETLSYPIMPAGAHTPSAHGDRRSRHRTTSPSAGSRRMSNTSCRLFFFFFLGVSLHQFWGCRCPGAGVRVRRG